MTSDDKEFVFETESKPPLVLQVDEGDYVILRNGGDDLMDLLDACAISIDSDNIYVLKKDSKGMYEWVTTGTPEEDNIRSIK